MNKTEFKNFILETAKKFSKTEDADQSATSLQEEQDVSITSEEVKILAEDMKKINKKIDLRNPLISPEFFDKVNKSTLQENVEKELPQKDRWQDLYNYRIPKDEKR